MAREALLHQEAGQFEVVVEALDDNHATWIDFRLAEEELACRREGSFRFQQMEESLGELLVRSAGRAFEIFRGLGVVQAVEKIDLIAAVDPPPDGRSLRRDLGIFSTPLTSQLRFRS